MITDAEHRNLVVRNSRSASRHPLAIAGTSPPSATVENRSGWLSGASAWPNGLT